MKKRVSRFALISGACFILYVMIWQLLYMPIVYDRSLLSVLTMPSFWLFDAPLIVFSVMLLLQKKNMVMLVSWCIQAVLSIVDCIDYIKSWLDDYYYFSMVARFVLPEFLRIAYLILVAVILLFVCLPKLEKNIKKLSSLWFVPMVLVAGAWIIDNCFDLSWISVLGDEYGAWNWSRVIDLVEVAAVIFFCLWLWYDWGKPKWTKKSPVLAEAAPALSVADQLLHYKELLDMGAITQEEFDAKKKQLLDL